MAQRYFSNKYCPSLKTLNTGITLFTDFVILLFKHQITCVFLVLAFLAKICDGFLAFSIISVKTRYVENTNFNSKTFKLKYVHVA